MNEREKIVRRWLLMWLQGENLGIREIFAEDGAEAITHWFAEWLTRGQVLVWDVHRFFHAGDQTAVTWYFQCRMGEDKPVGFEGVSVVRWREDGKIASLTEYCCEPEQYDPYASGPEPVFKATERALYEQFSGGGM